MSGWLAVVARAGETVDRGRWQQSLAVACRFGPRAVDEEHAPAAAIAAWRRDAGEYPQGGRLVRHGAGASAVAWVGQCLDDDGGEHSAAAADLLAGPDPIAGGVAQLNGEFAAAVFDRGRGAASPAALTLWTDRHRHYPIYVWRDDRVAVASTDLRCLIPWVDRPRVDLESFDLLVRCGELIEGRTILAGVWMLPPAARFSLVPGGSDTTDGPSVYWRLEHRPDGSIREADAAAELAGRLTRAVRRVEATGARLGVPLSGGLDSRLLLALCADPSRVHSFTWGNPGCRDIAYAAALARRVGSPHHVRTWEPETYAPWWDRGADVTAGCFGIRDMYVLPFVPLLASHCDVTLNGLAGDVFLGGNFLKRPWLDEPALANLADASWRWRVSPGDDDAADRLLGTSADSRPGYDAWRASVTARAGHGPVERLVDWLLENRIQRFTNCGSALLRTGVESRSPFFDRDVVDFLVRVPLRYRFRHRLYLSVLARASRDAAAVPWQRTAIPPGWGRAAATLSLAAHRGTRMALKPLGVDPFPGMTCGDPSAWLRGPWREPARRILFDDRCLSRGLVRPDALRELWDAHQSGRDASRVLGLIIASELFLRQALDGESADTNLAATGVAVA